MWGKEKKKQRTSPEWGALRYHGNSSDVRAGIMWLLIESVEEQANKTGTISHTHSETARARVTCMFAYARAPAPHTNKGMWLHTCTHTGPTHSSSSTVNEKQTMMIHWIFTIQTQLNWWNFTRASDLEWKRCKVSVCQLTLVLRNEATKKTRPLIAQQWSLSVSVASVTADQESGSLPWQQRSANPTSSAQPAVYRWQNLHVLHSTHSDPCLTKYIKHACWHVRHCASQHTRIAHFLSPSPTHSALGVKTLLGLIRIQANSVDKQSHW